MNQYTEPADVDRELFFFFAVHLIACEYVGEYHKIDDSDYDNIAG